jgi:hypothetical protein
VIIHLAMQRFWTLIQAGISSIPISPTSNWKKVYGKCCLKVSRGIVTWTSNINTNSTSTYTSLTKFKPANVIKLIGCYVLTNVRTNIVLIENNHGLVVNIKYFIHQIFMEIITYKHFQTFSWCSKFLDNRYSFNCTHFLYNDSIVTLVMRHFNIFQLRTA